MGWPQPLYFNDRKTDYVICCRQVTDPLSTHSPRSVNTAPSLASHTAFLCCLHSPVSGVFPADRCINGCKNGCTQMDVKTEVLICFSSDFLKVTEQMKQMEHPCERDLKGKPYLCCIFISFQFFYMFPKAVTKSPCPFLKITLLLALKMVIIDYQGSLPLP